MVTDVVTPQLVQRFNATLNLGPVAPLAGNIAPRLIHFCLAQPAVAKVNLDEDGHPARGGFMPPIPLPRRMWAAGTIAFPGEIRIGETIRRHSRVADIQVKQGRTGELCFVSIEHLIETETGPAVKESQTLVYRGIEGARKPDAISIDQNENAVPQTIVQVTPTLLFRYSALTFNAHRIHYDRPYAVDVERYPGLVVHGPLQATLLMQLAIDLKGGNPPTRFEFRSVSPLFDDAPVQLFAIDRSGISLRLWTSRPHGPQAMVADAYWDEPLSSATPLGFRNASA